MGWYKRITKIAMPQTNVACPSCGAHLAVDVSQRVDERGSSAYEPGMSDICYTRCPVCNEYMSIKYHWSGRGMMWGFGAIEQVTSDAVIVGIVEEGKIFVRCTEIKDPGDWKAGREMGSIDEPELKNYTDKVPRQVPKEERQKPSVVLQKMTDPPSYRKHLQPVAEIRR